MKTKGFPILIIILLISAISCVEIQDCKVNHYGDVRIHNRTDAIVPIVVDVTWPGVNINRNSTILNGSTERYDRVPAGDITIWYKYLGKKYWSSENHYLTECEDYSISIYNSNAKSTMPELICKDSKGNIMQSFSKKEKH